MKSDTQLLNELAAKTDYLHVLTEHESLNLKKMLLIMVRDVMRLCETNGITCMLGGGSCLGAIRHKGFIPWDDDLDLMMFRDDYEKLIVLCRDGALGKDYEVNYPSDKFDSKNPYLKIYRKGTLDNELYNENTPFPDGVFIDVFPIDNTPRKAFIRKLRGLLSDSLLIISTCVLYSQYPSSKYKEFVSQTKETKRRYQLRVLIGSIFGVIPHRRWVYWFDRFSIYDKDTGYVTIPTGRKGYVGEVQKTTVFLPVKYVPFEDMELPIPSDYHTYLVGLYNNYMEMPPLEKRERHMVYQFKCELPE